MKLMQLEGKQLHVRLTMDTYVIKCSGFTALLALSLLIFVAY